MSGRPIHANTIEAVPIGPMATQKMKWAAIAKWHSINDERKAAGFAEISTKEFVRHTKISETDIYNAATHKEYIEAAMSIAKGESTMWFKGELKYLRESAKRLRDAGEDKDYLKVVMELASMLKFKDIDLSGLDDSEAKSTKEVIDEIMNLAKDEAVKTALNGTENGEIVAQKLVPALINASFKSGSKAKTDSASQPDRPIKTDLGERPNQPMDSVSEAENRAL